MLSKNGTSCGADESQCRDYGRIKGERSDKVGRTYEQCAECSRGDCDKRADICVRKVRSVLFRIFYLNKNKCSDKYIENEMLL